ncbi:three-helix bundle dimerization domain-containing protein [Nocardia sp. NPDC005978]|uniref:three-helix bundle dimerization domain-containing protein n=1 Tax=unclassified Nocardia TaxID=2637762 RepID=UPI0033B54317
MTETPVAHASNPSSGLSPDVQVALQRVTTRLNTEFTELVAAETVDATVQSAYEYIAREAKVEAFLPLLAERIARKRLRESMT